MDKMIDEKKCSETCPLVIHLTEAVALLKQEVQELRDEIARRKGNKARPRFTSSKMENKTGQNMSVKKSRKGKKRKKDIAIHNTEYVAINNPPNDSMHKGYTPFVTQDIIITPWNTRYMLERRQLPDGTYISAELPTGGSGHFEAPLRAHIQYLHFQMHVTQPLILEYLHEKGIQISAGQISNILIADKEKYHKEKDAILAAGIAASTHLGVDDTGARHNGANGYCTYIGNEYFAWFKSTPSKSRINFLTLLRGKYSDYTINEDALAYMEFYKLPSDIIERVRECVLPTKGAWKKYLRVLSVRKSRHQRIMTEAALIGSILHHGFNREMVILSDDAGQFAVFLHALCWIHAERHIQKLIPVTDAQRAEVERVQNQVWKLYSSLKRFKRCPNPAKARKIESRFDYIFSQETRYEQLTAVLKRIHNNRKELLLVLRRPEIPLHNNGSENAIREYVKRRKISGSTRSDDGQRCRDTFTSLKKTCRKLGVSFWEYLLDRAHGDGRIPQLPTLVLAKADNTS